MRSHLANATWGVVDYAAYPIGMLAVVPVLLHHLGAAQFGVWAFATAAANTGAIVASGFGDANIQKIASARGRSATAGEPYDRDTIELLVRNTMGIHLLLGVAIAGLVLLLAPFAASRLAVADPSLRDECLLSLRLAAAVVLLRALETVAVSTQRAFERYGAAVRIGIGGRLLSLLAAALLAVAGHSVVAILWAAVALQAAATWGQFFQIRQRLSIRSFSPTFQCSVAHSLLSFGVFSWLQAVAGVIFGQADRLFLGVSDGASAVAVYVLCVQLAQPIVGIAASALHFLFPALSRQIGLPASALRRIVLQAFACNLLCVAVMAVPLWALGPRLLVRWAGAAAARAGTPLLSFIVLGSALAALNVSGTYALLALGRVRAVTWIGIASGGAMLAAMPWLLSSRGVAGLALARLVCGALSLLVYVPLARLLFSSRPESAFVPLDSAATPGQMQQGVQG